MPVIVEVMDSFLDFSRELGAPEPPASLPRSWGLWCRNVSVNGKKRRVTKTFIHTIEAPNLASDTRKLRAFMKGKVSTKDEW